MTEMSSRPIRRTQVYAQDTKPTDTRDGVMWVDTSTKTRRSYVYSKQTGKWEAVAPVKVAEKNVANAFTESGLTVGNTGTYVKNGSVRLGNPNAGSIGYTMTSSYTGTATDGVGFTTSVPLEAVTFTVSANNAAAINDCHLVDSNGNTVAGGTPDIAPGDSYTFGNLQGLPAGDYGVLGTNSGDAVSDDGTAPTTSGVVSSTAAMFGSGAGEYFFDDVTVTEATDSGTVRTYWNKPADLFGWDVGVYTTTLPGDSSISVDAQEYAGGWTTVANNFNRGDSLPVDPSNNAALLFTLTRGTGGENPTVDSSSLRWKL